MLRTKEHNDKIRQGHLKRETHKKPKKCPLCEETKSRTEFGVRPDGYTKSYCLLCEKKYARARGMAYIKNRTLEQFQKDKASNRNTCLKKKYGITLAERNEMLLNQDGKCAICGTPETDSKRGRLHVDHCHASSKIRSLLCSMCNRGIGIFRDDPKLMKKAIAYLESWHMTSSFKKY